MRVMKVINKAGQSVEIGYDQVFPNIYSPYAIRQYVAGTESKDLYLGRFFAIQQNFQGQVEMLEQTIFDPNHNDYYGVGEVYSLHLYYLAKWQKEVRGVDQPNLLSLYFETHWDDDDLYNLIVKVITEDEPSQEDMALVLTKLWDLVHAEMDEAANWHGAEPTQEPLAVA